MPFTIRSAPASGLDILNSALDSIQSARGDELGGGAERGSYDVYQPLPVYVLDLEAAAKSDMLASARQCGWRYILSRGDQQATVDLDQKPDGASPSFHSITGGQHAEDLVKALAVVEEAPDTDLAGDYDLRILEVPAVYTSALWLWSEANSVFVPFLAEWNGGIQTFTIDPEFISKLQSIMQDRLGLAGAR